MPPSAPATQVPGSLTDAPHGTAGKPSVKKPSAKPLSEAEFVAQQAADAKAAMAAAWGDLTGALKNTGDLTLWAKRYPWLTTGAAAVAGFVASYTLIPTSKKEAAEKWEHLKSAVTGAPHPHSGVQPGVDAIEIDGQRFEAAGKPAPEKKPAEQGALAMLLAQAFSAIKPVVMNLVASKFGGKEPPHHDSNGDGEPGKK